MSLDPPALPDDVEALRRLIAAERQGLAASRAILVAKALEIEKLKFQIARLRRQQYGRSSKKMARALKQFELRLEELEAEEAAAPETPPQPNATETAKPGKSGRRPLPAHLPRHEIVHEPSCACPA
jgi:hypothetical protein